MKTFFRFAVPALLFAALAFGDDEPATEPTSVQADWGIGTAVRTASIPYASQNDSVSSFVPMLFYEGERWFWRGTGGGVHLFSEKEEKWELNALGRLRFVDLPSEYQNSLQGDDVDFGLQFHQDLNWGWWETEFLTEDKGN